MGDLQGQRALYTQTVVLGNDDLRGVCGICMALVEICSLARVTHVGHKGDFILEVVGAVVKHGVAQCHNDHLQDTPRLSPDNPSGFVVG